MAEAAQSIWPVEEPATDTLELTILMPCLNEAETIADCIAKAQSFLARAGIAGEVLVADNASTDASVVLALKSGARVVAVAERGYGAALRAGIAAARGCFVIMGDADGSYDFANLDAFVARLRDGADLVVGNRFGGIAPGAMPPLHRYLGNPLLSLIGRLCCGAPIGDFHCGLRGMRREAILGLNLRTAGMEFASEMVVRAALAGLSISQVPTTLAADGRSRPPHLRTWQDGWRHLRFLLMVSPRWLFLYPGLALVALGSMGTAFLCFGPVMITAGFGLGEHTFLVSAIAILLGAQLLGFGIIARHLGAATGLLARSPWLARLLSAIPLERGLVIALAIAGCGLAGCGWSVWQWAVVDFGPLTAPAVLRVLAASLVLVAIAVQMAFTLFLLAVIDMLGQRRNSDKP
jgi:hypothetical protein